MWLFYQAADENRKREILEFAIAERAAFGANKTDWMRFVSSLKSKGQKTEMMKSLSPEDKLKILKETLSGR